MAIESSPTLIFISLDLVLTFCIVTVFGLTRKIAPLILSSVQPSERVITPAFLLGVTVSAPATFQFLPTLFIYRFNDLKSASS